MRVDLTSIKIILDNLYALDTSYIRIIAIILLERLFRGALYNFQATWDISKNEMFAKEVEGDVSISLMILLHKYNFLDFEKKKITIARKNTTMLFDEVLSDIYKYEQLASQKGAFSTSAIRFSTFFREKYLQITPVVINFLSIHSVQNCRYKLSFIYQLIY